MLAEQVFISLFYIIVVIQLLYYFGIFSYFIFGKEVEIDVSEELPVSILISAKNEEVNLTQNLPYYIHQKHHLFELVLINDHSSDKTLKIMHDFKLQNSSIDITIVNMDKDSNGNKKLALTKGISIAKFPYLLFTDADCKPNSDKWITSMTKKLIKKQIVLGYGAYEKKKGSWLNKLIRFETLITALQYFSYAKMGYPYMGVGRNLAYRKNLFIKSNGFSKHINIRSGDDDLFINEVATKDNVAISCQTMAHTISKAHTNFKKWLHQKKRHITTANNYKLIHQVLLGLYFVSSFFFWALSLFLILYSNHFITVVVLLFIRLMVQYFYLFKATKKLNEKDLVIFVPLLELVLIGIQFYLFISNLLVKPKSW
ncbi:MAG TPA: glycosyltransferase [Flavobacteriia bacterium]|nr:glycosyltransferase [Flavobacteriia bacterium]